MDDYDGPGNTMCKCGHDKADHGKGKPHSCLNPDLECMCSRFSLSRQDARLLRYYPILDLRQTVLGLVLISHDKDTNRRLYRASPSVPFKPKGLMVWGVDNYTLITNIRLANTEQTLGGAVPARFFATAQSYEELQVQARENKITLPNWVNFTDVNPSTLVEVYTEGVIDNLCFWGTGLF